MKISFLLLLCLLQASVFSWWCPGHMLVTQIALLNINNSVSDMCNDLLLNTQDFPASSTFPTSACWADDLKTNGVHEFDNWHFINQVWTNGTNVPHPPLSADNVVSQITRIVSSLQASTSTVWSKAMLFRFLVHLVGDIHQPLHSVSLWNHQFPNGDQGGNRFIVSFQNMTNLHAVWDSGIGLYATDLSRPLSSASAMTLLNMATNITREYPESSFNGLADILDANIWANESYQIAVKYAYSTLVNGSTLDDKYIEAARIQARKQLALAGYRLAHILQNIPVIPVRRSLTNSQAAGIGIAIFVVGMFLGGLLIYVTPKKNPGAYSPININ